MSDSKKLKLDEPPQPHEILDCDEEEIALECVDDDEFVEFPDNDSSCRYKILNAQSVFEAMMEIVHETAEVIKLPIPTVMVLLNHVRWDKVSLLDVHYEDEEKLTKLANALIPSQTPNESMNLGDEKFDCEICYDTVSVENSSKMRCNHCFCKNCWASYLKAQIMDKGLSLRIPCPASPCPIFVEYEVVKAQVSEENIMSKYHQLITQDFVKSNRLFRWCPGIGCDQAVYVDNVDWIGVKCTCGLTFCYLCGKDWHEPIKCDMLASWLEKDRKGDAETLDWMRANTKNCPNCKTTIEKNGGCNRVTCRSCSKDFCWICMKYFDYNHYSCTRYVGVPEDEVNAIRESLKRYNHYSERYNAQVNSLKFEKKIMENANAQMKRLETELNIPWIEVQFFKEAAETLCLCRKTLMYLPISCQSPINRKYLKTIRETSRKRQRSYHGV